MAVWVAERLYHPDELSEVAKLVVALLDGGEQWLKWAASDTELRYHFSDESALMDAISTGLHSTDQLLLPITALLISPVKLMTFSAAELRLLCQAESGMEIDPAQLQPIWATHGLVSQNRFALVRQTLANWGVGLAPLFQTPTIDEWRALVALTEKLDDNLGIEAAEIAAFALPRARTPSEFCDFCMTYLACTRQLSLDGASAQARSAAGDAALETFLPLSFSLLDCPMVDRLAPPREVSAAISEWLRMGRSIGFARASRVVQQVVAHSGYHGQKGAEAGALIRSYIAKAQLLLKTKEIERGILAQDGVTCRFSVSHDRASGVIELTRAGLITLHSFNPRGLDQSVDASNGDEA